MLACVLRADGWEIVYLGQATPVVGRASQSPGAERVAAGAQRDHARSNVAPLERGFRDLVAGRVAWCPERGAS